MGITSPKPTKADVVGDFRRTQILDAARDAFARHGLAGTTIDGIAKRAGVAKGTVYLYYRSKDEILRQILDDDLGQLREATVPVIEGAASIDAKLTQFFAAVLGFFDRKRDFFEHAHFEMTPDVRRKAVQKFETVYRAQLDAWQKALEAGRRDGVIGDVDVNASAVTIVALASGLGKQRLRGWVSGPADDIARQAGTSLWKGLAAR